MPTERTIRQHFAHDNGCFQSRRSPVRFVRSGLRCRGTLVALVKGARCRGKLGEGARNLPIEVTDIKRLFNLGHKEQEEQEKREERRLLYLGRRCPLKGVEYLAVAASVFLIYYTAKEDFTKRR